MKNLLICGLALTMMGFTSMSFAKKSSGSSGKRSSSSSSKPSASTASKPNADASSKQNTDKSTDKQSKNHKNTKLHRCKLANGQIDTGKSQQECLQANGKWVKY